MFFLLAILSMMAYSLQGVLLVHWARKADPLSISTYRTLSLGITMLPLLFLAGKNEIIATLTHWPYLLMAGLTGITASILAMWRERFLPVGIGHTISNVVRTIGIIAIGWWIFSEHIPLAEWILIGLILIGGTILSLHKHDFEHLDSRAWIGVVLAIVANIFTAMSFSFMVYVAREVSPYAAGYFWELTIGLCGVVFILVRKLFTGQGFDRIGWPGFRRLALICSPTLIGTGGFAIATTLGPMGIASAIGAGGIAVSAILAHFIYREKLKSLQWLVIILIMLGIMGLKVV